MNISLTVNGNIHDVELEGNETLLEVLRALGYKSVKFGCGEGVCGACTVIIDGKAVNSCLIPAVTANGLSIITVEDLGDVQKLSTLQQAFIDAGAVQCGFCTPGMILSAKALLDRNPHPSENDIKDALDGNLCRCTGYVQIIEAVQLAAQRLHKQQTA